MNTVCLTGWPCPSETGPTYIYKRICSKRSNSSLGDNDDIYHEGNISEMSDFEVFFL